MAWNPALHPRGPDGRFTKSFARPASVGDRKRRDRTRRGLKPHVPFRTPDEAHGWLSGMSTRKGREPGQMDRMLAQLRASNQALRAGRYDPSGFAQLLAPTPEDVTVFRSVPADGFGNAAPADLQGMVVSDAGYFPTSLAPQAAQPGLVRMEIDVPAGTRAAASPDTSELVLDRELEMSVDEVSTGPDGSTTMHLTVLGTADGEQPDAPDEPADPGPGNDPPTPPKPPDAPASTTDAGGSERLARAIASGVRERRILGGGTIAKTELVTFNDGTQAIYKLTEDVDEFDMSGRDQQDAEQLASWLLGAVGARGPAVHRISDNEIYMEFVDGTVAGESEYRDGRPDIDYDSDQARLLGLADQLMHNNDRHVGNWLIDGNGEPMPIDHGIAFNDLDPDYADSPMVAHRNDPFAAHFRGRYPNEHQWADNDLSPGDAATIRARLEALRSEFARLGREDWYQAMMTRFEAIAGHATGTRDRL